MGLVRKHKVVVLLATILLVVGLLWAFWKPALIGAGRWLIIETPLRRSDLVVALGGDRGREEEAVRLLKRGMARWVLFVGSDVQSRDYRCLEVPAEQAVPPSAPAYTTYEEAMVTRAVVQERGLRSVVIVTSPYHLRRAYWMFKRVLKGTDVVLGVSAAPNRAFSMEAWWKSHFGRKVVLMEYAGIVYYWLTL